MIQCKNSKVKGLEKSKTNEYCDCAWEYFEENYTAEEFNKINQEVKTKKEAVEILMNDEGLLLHIMNCYIGEDTEESENEEGEVDEKAALKAVTTAECVKITAKKAKKMRGFDLEGYCACASDKLFENFTFEEIMNKSFKKGEKLEQLMQRCLLENMK